ncbi:hypothetical protein [Actinacidiphila oryziradicis]|uniref:hypothetical protein n=1 Tax=Actinacidiphila oryziradicis TaxID=2571141 RepID=UPI0023F38390|nr:hypothetical protein [Actinacidiphila oryziradicis]
MQDASDPDRLFDAVVIGEYERAFSGRQAHLIIPQPQSYGIAVWLPDADGPVNLADSAHQALIMLKGRRSSRRLPCRSPRDRRDSGVEGELRSE